MVERLMRMAEIPVGVAVPAFLWILTVTAAIRAEKIPVGERKPARRLIWVIFFTALGLTAHLGLRVWARLAGEPAVLAVFGNIRLSPGLGTALAGGAWTISLLFLFLAERSRFGKRPGFAGPIALILAALHLGLLAHPANAWQTGSPGGAWAVYRQIPMILLGLLAAVAALRDARAAGDRSYRALGYWSILALITMAAAAFLRGTVFVGPCMMILAALEIAVAIAAYRGLAAVPEEAPPARCPNLIGKDAKVHGEMLARDLVQVDGAFQGQMAAGDLIVGKNGRVEGTVVARNVTVSGQVQGEVEARGLLELIYTASLKGKVRLAGLVVEEGAFLAAECTRIAPAEDTRKEAAAVGENLPK